MAKYNLSANTVVNCDILNESEGMYIVRFENGAINSVDKDRVHSLNDIDEGVLDMAKKAGEEISKFGRKVVRKTKDVAGAIKDFFVNAFKLGGFVFFRDENDEMINASHPINSMIAAINNKSISVYPSEDTISLCKELGIEPRAIENFQFEGEYDGPMGIDEGFIVPKSTSILEAMNERESDYIKGHPIPLRSPKLAGKIPQYHDWTSQKIIKRLLKEYEKKLNGDTGTSPLFIWGAPGIGKTEITMGFVDIIEEKYGVRPNIIAINSRTVTAEGFSFPAVVKDEIESERIKDVPKDWMPVYDPESKKGKEYVEQARRLANGGKKDPETGKYSDGPGGIIFLDEYPRMNDDAMAALMHLPTTRMFGTNSQTLGDRWIVVGAGNRKVDVKGKGGRDFTPQDSPANTRWFYVNFVPSFDDWKIWADATYKGNKTQKNVHPDLVAYIKQSLDEGKTFGDEFGDFYNMTDLEYGETTTAEPKACPRSWFLASRSYYDLIDEYGDVSSIPDDEILDQIGIEVGDPVAKRFIEFVKKFKFTNEDAKAVWRRGRVMPATEKDLKGYLNAGNFENFMMNFVLPKLEEEYPNAANQNGISPENLLNAINFIESMAPQKTGGNGRLDAGILRKIFKVLGTDIAGVELIDYENDGSQDLYADPRNRVADILMSNDSAA
ncbi:MAG: hypothetical protein KIH03_10480 [Paludibacteraceae bacterium]|nr:hypothetical protein [Paludibacteraceae bacterium]